MPSLRCLPRAAPSYVSPPLPFLLRILLPSTLLLPLRPTPAYAASPFRCYHIRAIFALFCYTIFLYVVFHFNVLFSFPLFVLTIYVLIMRQLVSKRRLNIRCILFVNNFWARKGFCSRKFPFLKYAFVSYKEPSLGWVVGFLKHFFCFQLFLLNNRLL